MTAAANVLQIPATPEKELSERAANLIGQADRCAITDDATCEKATDLAKMLAGMAKKLEEHRKEITGPINEALRTINARYKKPAESIDAAVQKVKRAILTYTQAKQAAERKRLAEERERELAALAAAKVDEATETAVMEKLADAEQKAEVARPAVVRGDYGSAAVVRKTWSFTLIELADVPLEYLVLDETKVRQAIRSGVRAIPGLYVFEREDIAIR